ncbi:Stp1/IreP family PP2C-type Ser/Thr phosphatase [Corallococcus exiguus]|uniref:Stp1/IreP family PP2C-type Ser/Thr phosphatase n=1 Tax=Corallococcus exiguus TaxID=83462 RepID=A0A7Y1S747_9BACT|nr:MULTISPECIES: Stp1/IreP family PP2C-type Ser/Thr phosphatase [Corallococcus]RKI36329.1 Stp1/IreP family PP2C-type Ser/Thr phosphatase [Corallococcus sp. AB004]NBC40537.1 Stp1/IreP family PP2C-type Ser/Thr phosphatase [Corallococcus exiguus]NNC19388.1 Stp1/IreP family PP2C-type Ser/Thr phosphatase [Corallococcus exiguus]NPC73757.1 Stp1/IreP family PP2C-type Ser/Thr phosphatase [Corallococcus exiguus]NPD27011.1 Stp1/IreP family PP2C-type Ser/Thr phosphatase [Corallococcus exiguus]
MRIEVAGSTHVGMKRNHNEDNYLVLPEENLMVVADGMGGHSSGEIASRIAVDELGEFFRLTSKDQDATWPFKMDKQRNYDENRLATGIKLANARIFERATVDTKYKGMGTTIVSVHFAENGVYVGHVGDSRVYFFRGGMLQQVTEDHSLLNDYLKAKKLTPEEIENFPHKNVIVRALGMKEQVQVDVTRVDPLENDVFLLCSDGLSGMITDAQMQDILSRTPELEKACGQLIDLANAAGGNDNVTCVLARYHAA